MENEILRVKPKFNFIYELFMPTGRKIRTWLFGGIIFLIVYFLSGNFYTNDVEFIFDLLKFALLGLAGISLIMFAFNLIIQIIEYKKMEYVFYDDRVVYEDNFLNQHKKEILYSDIKEVELRRKIWDRINNKGVIMIHSNAEKKFNNGIIMFAIKDTEKVYNEVRKIVYANKEIK